MKLRLSSIVYRRWWLGQTRTYSASALWLFAILRFRNTLTYLLTYSHITPGHPARSPAPFPPPISRWYSINVSDCGAHLSGSSCWSWRYLRAGCFVGFVDVISERGQFALQLGSLPLGLYIQQTDHTSLP